MLSLLVSLLLFVVLSPFGCIGQTPDEGYWLRDESNPLLKPAGGWEEGAAFEPNVLYFEEERLWKMWYTAGWSFSSIGYANSTDGVHWVKSEKNPVVGGTSPNYHGYAARSSVIYIKESKEYRLYFADGNPYANIQVTRSTDGLLWSTPTLAIPSNYSTAVCGGYANTAPFYDRNGWHMFTECIGNNYPGQWQTMLFQSKDGITGWTLANDGKPLTSLAPIPGAMYGGPWVIQDLLQIDGVYQYWYHGSNVTSGTPTDLYYAESIDLINWVNVTRILTHLGGSSYEFDQVADPSVVIVNGQAYCYYDGVHNADATAAIGDAVFVPARFEFPLMKLKQEE